MRKKKRKKTPAIKALISSDTATTEYMLFHSSFLFFSLFPSFSAVFQDVVKLHDVIVLKSLNFFFKSSGERSAP